MKAPGAPEAELEKSRRLLRAILDNIPDPVWLKDKHGRFLACNNAFAEFYGRAAEDVLGRTVFEVNPQGADRVAREDEQVLRSRKPLRVEEPILDKKGGTRWFESIKSPIFDKSGEVAGTVGIARETTERKEAEAALRASEEQFRAMFEMASLGIAQADPRTGQWLRVNPKMSEITGYSASELLLMRVPDLTHADDQQRDWEAFQRVVRGEAPNYRLEKRYVRKDGSLAWVNVNMTVLRNAASQPTRTMAAIEDITERKRAEIALRASEVRYRRLFEAAKDGVLILNAETGMVMDVNPFLQQLLGFPHEAFLGKRIWELGFFKDIVANQAIFDKLQQEEYVRYDDKPLEAADGRRIDVEFVSNVYQMDDHKVIQCNIRDITERKHTNERVRSQADLLNLARDAILVCDMDRRIRYWNKGSENLYGWKAAEIHGRRTEDLQEIASEDPTAARERLLATGEWAGELQHVAKDGRHVTVSSRWTLVRDTEGRPESVLMINSDITEKKHLEAKFLRAQRLESIGSLASGIAHDLNNILAPIMMCVPLLREEQSNEGREQLLTLIEASTQRAVGIVKQLLGFGRGRAGQKTTLQVRHLLREVGRIARETFPRSIQIKEDCATDLLLVTGDATQLHQVLLNLCVNARDAMPLGGTLTLRAENVVLDENYVSTHKEVAAGPFVRIQVQDTGAGIPDSDREHIFESFFTTKGVDQGTGLGLTTVLGIVKNHHGFITFTTAEGKGTTFEIHLPAETAAKSTAKPRLPPTSAPRANGELILLVDDEPAVREAARRTLERHGYAVLLAQDGIEGLAQFTARQAEIRVVVTDFMMPQMDGVMLARALRRLSPRTPIIVSSGGLLAKPAGDPLQTFNALGIRHILHKPHNAELLLQALDEELHSTAQASPEGTEWP